MVSGRILVVEDEQNLGSTLVERLQREGYEIVWSKRVADSLLQMKSRAFDLAIVDVGLPDGSGFDIAGQIREKSPGTAVIFLTAFGSAEDRIRGLELGAEDYIVKPFHLKELILRVKNGLKRAKYVSGNLESIGTKLTIGKAQIHFQKFEAEVQGRTFPLTHKEVALLKLLIERRGRVVSRDEILDHAWSDDEFPTPRTIDNFILRLRRLVEYNPENPEIIRSVRGIGYLLMDGII